MDRQSVDADALSADPGGQRLSPRELKTIIALERSNASFLMFRDGQERLQTLTLPTQDRSLLIGRRDGVDLRMDWDPEVSGVHAELRYLGGSWCLNDDGLSRNGSYVNGRRISGSQRLGDRDQIRVGRTVLVYRAKLDDATLSTATPAAVWIGSNPNLTETQKRILVSLCRPLLDRTRYAAPASNQQIASDALLSIDAVKAQLRSLFAKFALDELPQNQKRARLAEIVLQAGVVTREDL